MNSVKIVEDFWAAVWKAPQDVDAIDRFVVDDLSLPRAASTLFRRTIQGLGKAVFGEGHRS